MRKLFTSVSGAARAIAAGAVSDDDLNTGLFFLSITSSEDIRTDEKLPPAAAAHLADAVDKALKERRCVLTLSRESYDEAKKNLYRLLNRLLALHGFAQISEDPVDERVDFRQGAVAARV